MTELEMLIPLKDEYMPDLYARIKLLEFYNAQALECEAAAARSQYVTFALQSAFTSAIEQGISKDAPQELANVALLIEEHRTDVEQLTKRREKVLRTHEALQDALTLWLANLYGFDAVKDKYELDLDNRVLRKEAIKPLEQET